MPMKNLLITSPTGAKITGPHEIEIDANDCVLRLSFPTADRRALHAVCKTVNFAIRFKTDAKHPDHSDLGNLARGEVNGIERS
jgi:hypothetical protein